MVLRIRDISLSFYFIITLFVMEIFLKVFTIGKLSFIGILYILLFTLPISILLWSICSLFSKGINYILSIGLSILLGVIFASQLAYFKYFKTFYVLVSIKNGSQIFSLWRDILFIIKENILLILLFFIPSLFLVAFKNRLFSFTKINCKFSLIGFLLVFVLQAFSFVILHLNDDNSKKNYNLYMNRNNPQLSVETFGVVTSLRLEVKNIVFGNNLNSNSVSSQLIYESPLENKAINIKEILQNEKSYNVMDIDFDSLINNEKDENIKNLHQYFNKVLPTEKNEYTGLYEGYNLIFITAEGFSPLAIHPDVTPTLYKMVNDGYQFTNFYTPLWDVSTTDGEYVACTGLLPMSDVWSFYESSDNYLPFVMGNQLKKLGYKTVAYHNHMYNFYKRNLSHPNMGYDYKGVGNGLKVKKVWPASDLEMMENTVDEYIDVEPFHAYYMTVSGHLRYSFDGNSMALKNKKSVDDLPYSSESKAYIATQIELDRAIGYINNQLEEKGIDDKTLIVLSPDHYPYGLDEQSINELAGHPVEQNFELYKSNLIIYTQNMSSVTIDKPCSSVDIIPTISNLLDLEYDSRLLVGRDIFSNCDPLVIFNNRSYITDKGKFDSTTDKFYPNKGVTIPEDYIEKTKRKVEGTFKYSANILDYDYYRKVLH